MAEGIWIFNCCGLCAHERDNKYCSQCIHGEHPYHDNKVLYFNHFLNKGDEKFDIESENKNMRLIPIEIFEKLVSQESDINDLLDKIIDEVGDIDDDIVINPNSFYDRKVYVRFSEVIKIINKYKTKSEKAE